MYEFINSLFLLFSVRCAGAVQCSRDKESDTLRCWCVQQARGGATGCRLLRKWHSMKKSWGADTVHAVLLARAVWLSSS